MKIIQLIGRFNVGGTANWLATLIPEMEKKGHYLLLYAGSVSDGEAEDSRFAQLGGKRLHMDSRNLAIVSDLKAIRSFRKVLKHEKPDILNTHTAKAGMIGRMAAIGLPVKTVHTFHGHLLFGYLSRTQRYLYVLLEKFLNLFTDAFVIVGQRTMNDLLTAGIGTADKMAVIYPYVESATLLIINRHSSTNAITVGWLGRVTAIKRPDRLVEIASLLPNINFVAGGNGDLFAKYAAIKLSNIKWLGWTSAEDFWTKCDIALLTSDNEGVPTSLIEAALSGIPIVATNVGGVEEVFTEGEGGFLAESDQDFAKLISLLANDSSTRIAMGDSARAFAVKRFGLEEFVNSHTRIYAIK